MYVPFSGIHTKQARTVKTLPIVLHATNVHSQKGKSQAYIRTRQVTLRSRRLAELAKHMPVKVAEDHSKELLSPMPGKIHSIAVKGTKAAVSLLCVRVPLRGVRVSTYSFQSITYTQKAMY